MDAALYCLLFSATNLAYVSVFPAPLAAAMRSRSYLGSVPEATGTGKAVYWDSANSRFDLAVADGSVKQNCVGFADVPNGNVYAFGDAVLFAGLTPGAKFYLDASTPGAITATAPSSNTVFVGIARNSGELFVDVDSVGGATTVAGTVSFFAMSSAPAGWLKANGAAVSRTTYSALFAAIGVLYGTGDGSTTFNLPDLRGEFIRGLDDSRGVDPGRAIGSSQADELKSHSHSSFTSIQQGASGGSSSLMGVGTTGATGGSETRPRNVALLACIKY